MARARISVNLLLLVSALLLVTGCSRRSEDVAAIKRCYTEFRAALVRHDHDTATNYISSELLSRYPNHQEMLKDYFRAFTAPDLAAGTELGSDAWVDFDRKNKSNAFLFPHRPPSVGYGFVKETNGWKITVNVHPIMD